MTGKYGYHTALISFRSKDAWHHYKMSPGCNGAEIPFIGLVISSDHEANVQLLLEMIRDALDAMIVANNTTRG